MLSNVAPSLHAKRRALAFGYTGENFTAEEWLSLVEECGGPPDPLPRWLSEWISRKTVENAAILEGYVVSSGEERAILLGGYVLERAGEDRGSRVEVSKPLIGPSTSNSSYRRCADGCPAVRPGASSGDAGALALAEAGAFDPVELLGRHVSGEWEDLDAFDRRENETALRSGARIFSAYQTPQGERVWIITEAADDQGARRSTCILLPEQY